MPKHQGPIRKLIDPFSIPAQMNNLSILIVAYVTFSVGSETQCSDHDNSHYLHFIWYGSNIVCFGSLILSLLYMLGIIDFLFNKVIPCGQVCLTINTLLVFVAGVLYHFVATIYGVVELFWGGKSQCVQLEMFKKITCFIYLLWLFIVILYLLFNWYRERLRMNIASLNTSLVHG